MESSNPKSVRNEAISIAAETLVGPKRPRTERFPGVVDPDASVRPREAATSGPALDHPATRVAMTRRSRRLMLLFVIALAIYAAGLWSTIDGGHPGLLIIGILAVAWAVVALSWFARTKRVLREANWVTWPAAQMLVSPAKSGVLVPRPLALVVFNWWVVQLFDFEADKRFLVATFDPGESRRGMFENSPGKVWACGDPEGMIVLSSAGGDSPTLFMSRFPTSRRRHIESEFAAQFPVGAPDQWEPVSEHMFGEQVTYRGSIVWPKPPGQTDEFDHSEANRRRWRRSE